MSEPDLARQLMAWTPPVRPILAIDPALVRSGGCLIAAHPAGCRVLTWTWAPPEGLDPIERLAWLRARLMAALQLHRPGLVGLEGYSFGSLNRQHALGELGGVLRLGVHDAGVALALVSPASHKKLVTGSGKAAKSQVCKELYKRFGLDVGQEDAADAACVALTLLVKLQGAPGSVVLPKVHLVGLDKVMIRPPRRVFRQREFRATGCTLAQ